MNDALEWLILSRILAIIIGIALFIRWTFKAWQEIYHDKYGFQDPPPWVQEEKGRKYGSRYGPKR